MIKKPIGYDEAATLGTGDFEEITVGGHVCIIKTAHEDVRNGKRYLVLLFDIAPEDAQGGYYTRLYNRRVQSLQNKDDGVVRWPGTYWQGLEGKSTAFSRVSSPVLRRATPDTPGTGMRKRSKAKSSAVCSGVSSTSAEMECLTGARNACMLAAWRASQT